MEKNQIKYDDILKKLQDKDYRLTDIRKAIVKIFTTEKDISINDIISKLKKDNNVVNIMSVYNTIDLLMKEHIIHANVFEDKQVYYELSDNAIHAICNICHKVIHLTDDDIAKAGFLNIDRLTKFLEAKKNFHFSHFTLEVHGICSSCQKHMKKV